jgi:uncharacterized protein YyaL (SSP411 family)
MPSHPKNRLANEKSSYLLEHADNPVDWYPWGPEALEHAQALGRPIFLSIGYSACHWCHVMARESFCNNEIAGLLRERFISIKVDREERPDIDSIYMNALIELTGQGGWPLNIFLTPDQKPFFGGTYFPPVTKNQRPGFAEIVLQADEIYRGAKEGLQAGTDRAMRKLMVEKPSSAAGQNTRMESAGALMDRAVQFLTERYDGENGGFGGGMKFPDPMIYTLLLRHWNRSGSAESMDMLDKSLSGMIEGGMCDQLGGGFHRYATDKHWRIPHFEKMLNDNGLLARLFVDTFQATKQEIYQNAFRGILEYVLREMSSEDGMFFSSQSAVSPLGEGDYYLWELKEVLNLLGPKHAQIFARAYGLKAAGNFSGKNVLHVNESLEKISEIEGLPIFEVSHIVKKGKETLFDVRQKRLVPLCDEKKITAWNGLMITAFSAAYTVVREKKYLIAASRAAEAVWNQRWTDAGLSRLDPSQNIAGGLEDYSSLLEGLIHLYEASLDSRWIERAKALAGKMIEEFEDSEEGGFFMTGKSAEKLIARIKIFADDSGPSANAVAALSLLRLSHLTGKAGFREAAERTLKASEMEKSPEAHTGLLAALDFFNSSVTEVVFAGEKEDAIFEEMNAWVYQDYRPNKVVLCNESDATSELLPLAGGKRSAAGRATAYVCQQGTCHPPVESRDALDRILEPPQEIRLNIFDKEKHADEIRASEEANFLNAMSEIFKHSGLGGGK